jgi:hypothetical protein
MRDVISALLRQLDPPSQQNAFNVRPLPRAGHCYVGRDGSGSAAILVRTEGAARAIPLRLAGIEARFGVPCLVSQAGSEPKTETLSVVVCSSQDSAVENTFATVMESLLALIRGAPSTTDLASAVDQIVALFQKLLRPAQRPLLGLVGELLVISAARSTAAAVSAWRTDIDERFDFVSGDLRLDAKASAGGLAMHSVSFEQTNPAAGTHALFAVVHVDHAAGGASLRDLIAMVEDRLEGDHRSVAKLWDVVGTTLGDTLPSALGWRFDIRTAESSLAFYDASTVPSLRAPLPPGVSAVRFSSDFRQVPAIDLVTWSSGLSPDESSILPKLR